MFIKKRPVFKKKNICLSKRDLYSSTSEPGIAARQARLMAPVPVKAWWYTRAGVVTAARRSTSFWATVVPSVVVYCAWRDSFMCFAACGSMLQTLQCGFQRSCRQRGAQRPYEPQLRHPLTCTVTWLIHVCVWRDKTHVSPCEGPQLLQLLSCTVRDMIHSCVCVWCDAIHVRMCE